MSTTILRLNQVVARTGLSRSTIYQRIHEGRFPVQISLGDRAVGWEEAAIENWLLDRVKASKSSTTEALEGWK